MENNTEVIQQQMTETRAALSEKLEALEEQVLSTVTDTTENVAHTVEQTVEAVKETVADTVSTVQETVSETVETVQETVSETVSTVQRIFDVRRHVENYPWAMFAGAVVVGYVGAQFLLPRSSSESSTAAGTSPSMFTPTGSSAPAPQGSTYTPTTSTMGSTMEAVGGGLSNLLSTLSPALNKLKEMAIGAATGLVGDMLLSATPETLRQSVLEVIDQITTGLGGKPVHGLAKQEGNDGNGRADGQHGGSQQGRGQTTQAPARHHSEAQQIGR